MQERVRAKLLGTRSSSSPVLRHNRLSGGAAAGAGAAGAGENSPREDLEVVEELTGPALLTAVRLVVGKAQEDLQGCLHCKNVLILDVPLRRLRVH